MYRRGSPEHLEAQAAGVVERLPPLVPATRAAIDNAERAIRAPLPPLLRRLYAEIGDGGFGPGSGVFSVDSVYSDDIGQKVLWKWSKKPSGRTLVPICHWGCGIMSFIDVTSSPFPMWAWDPNPVPRDELGKALVPEHIAFAEWLLRWAEGNLFQPTLVQDAVTGNWRAATQAESAQMLADP